jgi:hypothetical protein
MSSLTETEREDFLRLGFVGGFPLLSPSECRAVADQAFERRSGEWMKGLHLRAGPALRTGLREEVVGRVSSLLGEDVLLWGCQVVRQRPGERHRWHADVEACTWPCVNAWVALENVTPLSTLSLIPGSHRFSLTPQDLARDRDIDVHDFASIAAVARVWDVEAGVVSANVGSGDFILFNGRSWHASRNDGSEVRTALLLQYSPPDADIRRPVSYDSPVQWHAEKPSCVIARGRDRIGLNTLVGEPEWTGKPDYPR